MNKKIDTPDAGKSMVVSSPKLPAERPAPKLPAERPAVQWRDFNRFAENAKALREYRDDLHEHFWRTPDDDYLTADAIECAAEEYDELLGEVRAGFERFEPAENYENDDDEGVLKHSHVAKRIGVLLGSFPNASPHEPKGYAKMLVEHVAAIPRLTNVALESACREIVETQKFAPTISEMVKTIREQIEQWQRRRSVIDGFNNLQKNVIKALREREQKQQKDAREQEIKQAINQATYAAHSATATTQRLAQEIERAKTELARLIEAQTRQLEDTQRLQQLEQQRFAELQNERNEHIAKLVERHAEAEKRESEARSVLLKLTEPPEEVEAAAATEAAAKHNGAGASPLPPAE